MFKKRWIAILVVFALFTGVAYAQSIGGQLQLGMDLLKGNNVKETDIMTGGSYADGPYHEAKLSATFGDGQAGGRLVLNNNMLWGWIQWRPTEIFRLKIGRDGDGEFGHAQIAGWGFTGEAKNSVGAYSDYNGSLSMRYRHAGLNYGGIDGGAEFALSTSWFLGEYLQVNVGWPNFGNSTLEVTDRLSRTHISGTYRIEDVGNVRFALVGKGGLAKDASGDVGDIFLTFQSSQIVQGLNFEVGFKYGLPHRKDLGEDGGFELDTDTAAHMEAGIGVNFTKDDFGLKIRGGSHFGGKDGGEARERAGFGLGILPNYRVNPNVIVFFHAGFGSEFDTDAFHWFINPYVWVRAGESVRFWTGLQLIDERVARDGQFRFVVPFGFNCYF